MFSYTKPNWEIEMLKISQNDSGLTEKVFQKGSILLKEGEQADNVYILKEGDVAISVAGEEVCKVCTPNAVFGEVSALLSMENSATVVAVRRTVVWVIDDFQAYLTANPDAMLSVSRQLAKRLNNMNINFLEARGALKDVQEKYRQLIIRSDTIALDKETMEKLEGRSRGENSTIAANDLGGLLKKVEGLLNNQIF